MISIFLQLLRSDSKQTYDLVPPMFKIKHDRKYVIVVDSNRMRMTQS